MRKEDRDMSGKQEMACHLPRIRLGGAGDQVSSNSFPKELSDSPGGIIND